MYSNNILNFQEFRTILNACTKKSGNTTIIYMYIYTLRERETEIERERERETEIGTD